MRTPYYSWPLVSALRYTFMNHVSAWSEEKEGAFGRGREKEWQYVVPVPKMFARMLKIEFINTVSATIIPPFLEVPPP